MIVTYELHIAEIEKKLQDQTQVEEEINALKSKIQEQDHQLREGGDSFGKISQL